MIKLKTSINKLNRELYRRSDVEGILQVNSGLNLSDINPVSYTHLCLVYDIYILEHDFLLPWIFLHECETYW